MVAEGSGSAIAGVIAAACDGAGKVIVGPRAISRGPLFSGLGQLPIGGRSSATNFEQRLIAAVHFVFFASRPISRHVINSVYVGSKCITVFTHLARSADG
jgi:hypothetical protein